MSLELVGQIIGVFVTISAIISNQMEKRWQIMLGLAITNILSVVNTFLVGTGISVTLLCFVAVCNSLVNAYKSKKGIANTSLEKIVFSVLYIVAWGIGFYLSYIGGKASWLELLPLAATIFFILSMIFPKERDIRICSLINMLIYIVYHVIFGNIAVMAQIFSSVSVCIALFRYREKKPKNAEDKDN